MCSTPKRSRTAPGEPSEDPAASLSALYASVVGNEASRSKLPLAVAHELEERFIRDGWPYGRVYGTEAELATAYGVGRDVMRETMRVLAVRETAVMRRGAHGGLEVRGPTAAHLTRMLEGFLHISALPRSDVLDAWCALHVAAMRQVAESREGRLPMLDVLPGESAVASLRRFAQRLMACAGNTVLTRFAELLTPLLPPLTIGTPSAWFEPMLRGVIADLQHGRADDAARRTRRLFCAVERHNLHALQRQLGGRAVDMPLPSEELDHRLQMPALNVLRMLMASVDPRDWVRGVPLGNEFDLCDRFGVDRSVIRQAIRMMEDAGTAAMLPGRGRGLVTRRPGTAPISRLLCIFLLSQRVPKADAESAFRLLSIEVAVLGAAAVSRGHADAIRSLREHLHHLHNGQQSVSALQPIERLQGCLAGNDVLVAFLDGVKAFLSWDMAEQLTLPSWVVNLYVAATQSVLNAIDQGNRTEAARLQAHKLDVMKRCRELIGSAFPSQPAAQAAAVLPERTEEDPHEPEPQPGVREARRLGIVGGLDVDRQDS
jgi:DNA-binding FadR family transcriptional regulator